MRSPFTQIPESEWVADNRLAFAIHDAFPVTEGHTLVITKREVATWFEATKEEQGAVLHLVDEVKADLDRRLRPAGYNVGFNAGAVAGQTVMHLHVHVIPRYAGDMDDPRGGVRHVIPSKGNYKKHRKVQLTTGGSGSHFLSVVRPLIRQADQIDIVAAFVQESGLIGLKYDLQDALARGAQVRLLTGDYLGITQADALELLLDWQTTHLRPDAEMDEESEGAPSTSLLEARVVEVRGDVRSFHPKSWRFEGPKLRVGFVGSSNISRLALTDGIEWNLRVDGDQDTPAFEELREAFDQLWIRGRALEKDWVEAYARRAQRAGKVSIDLELEDGPPTPLPVAHEVQQRALKELALAREQGRTRALLVLATGLGKTLAAVFDFRQVWERKDGQPPRLLFLAHRRELLLQAARSFRQLAREVGAYMSVSWFVEDAADLSGDMVFASVAKLARAPHLARLATHHFDYVVVDEVHHAAAASYRRILDSLDAGFTLGLTATPERADGADILGLFDDFIALNAGIDEGIRLGRLVPFHYYGVRDDIDYATIPWRNKRFDLEVLTMAAETEARMEALWKAWTEHPGQRTLVFCCTVRHANYVRAWLSDRGVRAAAIHSGEGADDRSTSLEQLASGQLDAVCAVDVLNEGVDVPSIDRVVMLRPTESGVVFVQQLGRGLRASEGKPSLRVIDFVGNDRMFLRRLRNLLELTGGDTRLSELIDQGAVELPEGCSVELELEAKTLMQSLFDVKSADPSERYYRELRAVRPVVRPRAGELVRAGFRLSALREKHGSWFGFVRAEGDLEDQEREVQTYLGPFLEELETTAMTKSFKMVLLRALIEMEALAGGADLEQVAQRSHRLLLRDPRLAEDIEDPTLRRPAGDEVSQRRWLAFWRKNPVAAWTQRTPAKRAWFDLFDGRLEPRWTLPPRLEPVAAAVVGELVDARLAEYRRREGSSVGRGFECRVTSNKREPILKLPSRKTQALPEPGADLDVRLPDGSVWLFRIQKELCNVARPLGASRNQLPDLLRGWFGPGAGHPGTAFRVRFVPGPEGWSLRPVQGARVLSLPRRALASYPDLAAAAGHAVSETLPQQAEAVELPLERELDLEAHFAVRVDGDSMDGGKAPLRPGDWAVFELARGQPAPAVEGRVALFETPGDGGGLRHQIKRLLRTEGGWVLRSDNPDGPTIDLTDDTRLIARLQVSFRPEQLAPERGAVLGEDDLAEAFGLSQASTESRRYGGHLFVFIRAAGDLLRPNLARLQVTPRPGETAFLIAEDEGSFRYLGVGRQDSLLSGWELPDVDAPTFARFGVGEAKVSRDLPAGALSLAGRVLDALSALPPDLRGIQNPRGVRATVVGFSNRGGVRIQPEEGKPRSVSRTDLAWVCAAQADVEAAGGVLDEARVNEARYLEGASRASTRWIDTGWAIGLWNRAKDRLPEQTELLHPQVDGRVLDAEFFVERRDGRTAVIVESRGMAGKNARNREYDAGLELVLRRLGALSIPLTDGLLDSLTQRDRPESERRLEGEALSWPIHIEDPVQLRGALAAAMARTGRKPGAKGGGNRNKRIRLVLGEAAERWPLADLANRLVDRGDD